MRRGIILMFIAFLIGCSESSTSYRQNTGEITAEAMEYYKRFIYEGKIRGVDLSNIKITIIDNNLGNFSGTCYQSEMVVELNWEQIQIGTDYLGAWYKEYVIYHELGHCLLQLKHSEEIILMRKYFPEDLIDYQINRNNLLDQLFNSPIINNRVN